MLFRLTSLALLAGLAFPSALSAQSYTEMAGTYQVTDITPDGSIVVGVGDGGGFYWRWRVDPAPTYIGGVDAQGVSDDGTVIVGCIIDPVLNREVAGRWTAATGWQNLGYLPNALSCPSRSNAYDVSGDGTAVVGLSWDGCTGRGFLWTAATGMQELEPLGPPTGDDHNRATTISGDGSSIAGFAQGSFNRTPAYWDADTSGFVLNLNFQGEIYGFNEDGSKSVGTLYTGNPSGSYSAVIRNQGTGATTDLGTLNGGDWGGNAKDISEDGKTVVGFDVMGLALEAWVWTLADGIVSLEDRLTMAGVANVPYIHSCTAVSDDGTVVVGTGGAGFGSGFVADLTGGDDAWLNIGGGAVGINGIPQLAGTGSLVGGTPVGIELTNARESTLTVAWVSFNPTPVAALGGTIHTLPYNNQFLFNTSAAGSITLNTIWPVGVPSGAKAWFQFLIADSSSIHGIVPSNALRATAP